MNQVIEAIGYKDLAKGIRRRFRQAKGWSGRCQFVSPSLGLGNGHDHAGGLCNHSSLACIFGPDSHVAAVSG